MFGYYAVQLAPPGCDTLAANRMPCRIAGGLSPDCTLHCDPAQLPFASASIDLLVLPHTLDFHADPHQVLREAERVLVPEGRLLLTGFNPWSAWGGARLWHRRRGMPWGCHFVGLPRIRDWLALLGLEPASTRTDCHVLPFASSLWLDRFAFMERLGSRWWPVGGGVYCLEAVKRVRGMRLITPAWKSARRVRTPVAVPVPDRSVSHLQESEPR